MAQRCLIHMFECTFSLLKSILFCIMVVWGRDRPVASTATQGTQDVISLQSQGNIHVTTHHLYSWLFILLPHCVLPVCTLLSCELARFPRCARNILRQHQAKACLQICPVPRPLGHLHFLSNGLSCPKYQHPSSNIARSQVIYCLWHRRKVLKTAHDFHGAKLCSSF